MQFYLNKHTILTTSSEFLKQETWLKNITVVLSKDTETFTSTRRGGPISLRCLQNTKSFQVIDEAQWSLLLQTEGAVQPGRTCRVVWGILLILLESLPKRLCFLTGKKSTECGGGGGSICCFQYPSLKDSWNWYLQNKWICLANQTTLL